MVSLLSGQREIVFSDIVLSYGWDVKIPGLDLVRCIIAAEIYHKIKDEGITTNFIGVIGKKGQLNTRVTDFVQVGKLIRVKTCPISSANNCMSCPESIRVSEIIFRKINDVEIVYPKESLEVKKIYGDVVLDNISQVLENSIFLYKGFNVVSKWLEFYCRCGSGKVPPDIVLTTACFYMALANLYCDRKIFDVPVADEIVGWVSC